MNKECGFVNVNTIFIFLKTLLKYLHFNGFCKDYVEEVGGGLAKGSTIQSEIH